MAVDSDGTSPFGSSGFTGVTGDFTPEKNV